MTQSSKPAPPKKPLTDFFLFKKAMFSKTKEAYPQAKITELTKIISENWKNLDQAEKEKYNKKSKEAKAQYERDIKAYEAKYGKIEKKKRKSQRNLKKEQEDEDVEGEEDKEDEEDKITDSKDDFEKLLPPKRPLSSFAFFKADVSQKIKERRPDLKLNQLTRVISEAWKSLERPERQRYDKQSQEAKANYEREKKNYEVKSEEIEKKSESPEDKKGKDSTGKSTGKSTTDKSVKKNKEEQDDEEVSLICENKDKDKDEEKDKDIVPNMKIQYRNGFSISLYNNEFKEIQVTGEGIKFLTQDDRQIKMKVPSQWSQNIKF